MVCLYGALPAATYTTWFAYAAHHQPLTLGFTGLGFRDEGLLTLGFTGLGFRDEGLGLTMTSRAAVEGAIGTGSVIVRVILVMIYAWHSAMV